jgi:dsDNA-specific endonuclease/ATPase MutS2
MQERAMAGATAGWAFMLLRNMAALGGDPIPTHAAGVPMTASQNAFQEAHPLHLTAIALRSAGQVVDIQLSTARALIRTHARAAAAFGLPDWSGLFDSQDDRVRRAFSASAEQLLQTAQQANEAAAELQRQFGRVLETQAAQATENWQRGLEELGQQAQESLGQLTETARQTAEQAARSAEQLGRQVQDGVRNAGSQFGQATRDIGQTLQRASGDGADALRQGGQQAADEARQSGDGLREAILSAGDATRQASADVSKERRPSKAA